MEKIDDGGSAFPFRVKFPDGSDGVSAGMSLRDWFAGMAMQGYASNPSSGYQKWPDDPVKEAYLLADAMLAARKQSEKPE